MKILNNKENYKELKVDTMWRCVALSHNPHFSRVDNRLLCITEIKQCKGKS